MNIHRSIERKNERLAFRINKKYQEGLRTGRPISYYLHPSFLPLYAKRLALIALSLCTGKRSTFRSFLQIITTRYFPHYLNQRRWSQNNILCELIRTAFCYRHYSLKTLHPVLPDSVILRNKTIELRRSRNPLVSIIVDCRDGLSTLYNNLLSLQEGLDYDISVEVFVLYHGRAEAITSFLEKNARGVSTVALSDKDDFGIYFDKIIGQVSSKYIGVLNSSVQVSQNWLRPLVDLLQSDESIFCVESKQLYSSGFLKHAGGVMINETTFKSYGNHDFEQKSQYNFVREVDFCSFDCLLLRKRDYLDLKDEPSITLNRPFTWQDICIRAKCRLNKRSVYNPLSTVTSHRDPYISRTNSNKNLLEQPNEVLGDEEYLTTINRAARRHLPSRSILIVDWKLPEHDRDSGSLRLFRIIAVLKTLNMHVMFMPYLKEKTDPYYSSLLGLGVEPIFSFPDGSCLEHAHALETLKYVWVLRPELNEQLRDRVRKIQHVKWIYDTVDLHHLRLMREADLNCDGKLKKMAAEMEALEIGIARSADATLTVTSNEKVLLKSKGVKNIHVVPNIHTKKEKGYAIPKFEDREGLLFIGGYGHTPNVDAAIWLVNEIMPLVWEIFPSVPLYLLGNNPPKDLLKLGGPYVNIPGYIPNVDEYFKKNRVFVSPLRYGAGMKGKIGQSLEYGLPIVSTSIGAEGMDLVHEHHILVADNSVDFAKQIVRLYTDPELWSKLSASSDSALHQYSEESVKSNLESLFHSLG